MKKRNILILALLISTAALKAEIKTKVFYVDLKDQNVAAQPIKEFGQNPPEKANKKIVVYPEIEFQTIEGIGGAFNEIGGEALMSLPKKDREAVMQSMFNLENGAGFSFCRTAVGASDFGIDAYSYSEVADDYKMEHFSVEREKTSVLPYIQMAYKNNPDLVMFASPWSPPAWMKYSGYMDRGVEFPEKNHLKDEKKIYEAYALYFARYVQTYAEHGINISRLIIQNEPDVHTKYPSCVMPPQQMGMFAKKYLRPAFKKHKVKTEIWAGTFRTAEQLDAVEFVANEDLRESVDGIGFQYTKPRYNSDMKALFPDVNMMHTEGACFNGENSIEQAKKRLEEVASYINYGSPNFCYWNMILNETTESGWAWKQNSLINIDRKNKTVTYNPDYAVMALLSKYMRPGAKRVAGFSRSTLMSIKDGGKVYLFVQNDSKNTDKYECRIGDEKVVVEIPAQSVATIELSL